MAGQTKQKNNIRCVLRSLFDNSLSIELKHKVPVFLGRIKEQKIPDLSCSRQQLEVVPDFESQRLIIRKVGQGNSAVNGKLLETSDPIEAGNNDKIEVVNGKYVFVVNFHPSSHSTVPAISRQPVANTAESSNTSTAATMFLKQSALPKLGTWEDVDNGKLLIFTPCNVSSSSKIASYDLDGTLINTKSGNVYPKDKTDWKPAHQTVRGKLKKLHENGYKLVIFTNQAGIGRGRNKPSDFKEKIEDVLRYFGVPIQVFVATSDSIYRKPAPGMWDFLISKKNDNVEVNTDESFFCGDAAGRPASVEFKKKKKDFASSDRLFAMNINVTFYTPEEHFLSQKPCPYELPNFHPARLSTDVPLTDPLDAVIAQKATVEVIVMIGPQGSGKSHFVKDYLAPEGYVYINRDTLGSWQKCVMILEQALKDQSSAVIDNTNPDRESRSRYINVAKQWNVPVRAFLMNVHYDHVKHNNKFRELTDSSHVPIAQAVINTYYSKYEEPSLEEGFSEIVKVNFVPRFSDPQHKKLYSYYLS